MKWTSITYVKKGGTTETFRPFIRIGKFFYGKVELIMRKQRIVVKIGSSSLTNENDGLSENKLNEHVDAIAKIKKLGNEVVLISSGAVAAGFKRLGYPIRPVTIAGKQSAAAVGQSLLMQSYGESFSRYDIVTAQMLLTRNNFKNRAQYRNIYQTLTELLHRNVLPIINENDSVSIDELTFGDNDMLSALVSGIISADFLIMLTDTNGLYNKDPRTHSDAKKYDYLNEINDQLLGQAKESGSAVGTGGMRSKLEAAHTALSVGVKCFIGKGFGPNKLLDVLKGEGDGTYIGAPTSFWVKNSKQWLALHSSISGSIVVDNGAEEALLNMGRSLLPAGIISIEGSFNSGDVVEIRNKKGKQIARGEVNFSASELEKIKGLPSEKAKNITNRSVTEVIHRDHMIIQTLI